MASVVCMKPNLSNMGATLGPAYTIQSEEGNLAVITGVSL